MILSNLYVVSLINGMDAGVPSPFRSALRAIFEGLERSDRHRAGNSQQYQLPIFMTSMDTFQAVQVCYVVLSAATRGREQWPGFQYIMNVSLSGNIIAG